MKPRLTWKLFFSAVVLGLGAATVSSYLSRKHSPQLSIKKRKDKKRNIFLTSDNNEFYFNKKALDQFLSYQDTMQTYTFAIIDANLKENHQAEIQKGIVIVDPLGRVQPLKDIQSTLFELPTGEKAMEFVAQVKKYQVQEPSENSFEVENERPILQGHFQILLQKGTHIINKDLEQDVPLATLHLETVPPRLRLAEESLNENLSQEIKNSGKIILELEKGGLNEDLILDQVDPSYFNIQKYEKEEGKAEGQMWHPREMRIVESGKFQLDLASEENHPLSPGTYEIFIPSDKLQDKAGNPIMGLRFEVSGPYSWSQKTYPH